MTRSNTSIWSSLLLAMMATLLMGHAHAATITVLESFEDNTDNVLLINRRVQTVDQTTANVGGRITHGTKAARLEFSSINGTQGDFRVVLSPGASAMLQAAVRANQPGRFFIMYDMTWDGSGSGWSNHELRLGEWNIGTLMRGGGGRVMTLALDLSDDIPENFDLGLMGENGDQTYLDFEFHGNLSEDQSVILDNIRLLDTSPGDTETLVTVLNSFDSDLGALSPFGRAQTPAVNNNPDYISEGAGSARIELTGSGRYAQDIQLDINSPRLSEILQVPPEERYRYSLAWDWAYDSRNGATASWFLQLIPDEVDTQQGTYGPGLFRTRTINLGTVPWTAPPVLRLVHNSNWSGGTADVYIDNLRLIDTGVPSLTITLTDTPLREEGFAFNWNAESGETYEIYRTSSFGTWEKVGEVTADSELGSFVDLSPPSSGAFYKVELVRGTP